MPEEQLQWVENVNDKRPPVYKDGADWVFRASSVLTCENALIGVKLGFDLSPPGRILRDAFQRGVNAEPVVKEYMNEVMGPVTVVEECNVRVAPGIIIRGHPDGDSPYGLHEYKNLGLSFYTSWVNGGLEQMGPLGQKYASQGLVYCMAMERPEIIFACRNEYDGDITWRIYNQGDLFSILKTSWDEIEDKLQRVIEAREWPGCTEEEFGCPIWKYHKVGFDEIMSFPEASTEIIEFEPGVLEAIIDLREGQQRLKYLTEKVKRQLGKNPYNRKIDGIAVNYYSRRGRSFPDLKKMAADGIDIQKYMSPPGEEWVLQIKALDD